MLKTQLSSFQKRDFQTFLVIILMGAGLRFYQIGKQPLWLDESYSVWLSGHSIPEIVRYTINLDQHPPFYYILLHLWIRLGGNSEAWVRSLSALFGVLTIMVMYSMGKKLAGSRGGFLAALVLAIAPFHIQFAQEARAYTLLGLCAGLTMLATIHLLTDPQAQTQPIGQQTGTFLRELGRGRRLPLSTLTTDLTWLGYMVFTALVVYGHNTAVFLPFTVNLFVLGLLLCRRFIPVRQGQLQAPSLRSWLVAQAGAFLFWSPWLPGFYKQLTGVMSEFWIQKPTSTVVFSTLREFLLAWLPARIGWQGWIWAGFVGLLAMALLRYRRSLGHFILLALLFSVPFFSELLASFWRPIFYDRTLIWCTLPLYLLIAAGIDQLRLRPYIVTASVILITLSWLSVSSYFTYYEKERWDLAANYVAENLSTGDIIVFNAGWVELPFDYYFQRVHQGVEEFGAPATLFERGVLEPQMTAADLPRLQEILRGHTRVWLVYSHNWWTDPDGLVPKALSAQLHLTASRMFNGMQVQLYTHP